MRSSSDCSRFLLLIFLFFIFLYSKIDAQYPKKEKFYAVKEEVKLVRCETCQKAVKYLYRKTREMKDVAPAKKLEEEKIIDLVEKSCYPGRREGEWITKFDLVADNKELRLVEKESYGRCRKECQTIAKACEESIGEADTDLGELLWQDKLSLSKLINKFCYSISSACKKNAPKLRGKRTDEEFIVMTEDERKADEVLKQMRGMPGMPGMEMYSREDMEKMREQMSQKEEKKELPIDEEGLLYAGGEVSFFQIIKDGCTRFSSWMKNLYNTAFQKSEL
ncbi:hypothetical protein QZH41_020642 [Actinostola sp. cb2023]|nr:hypothetical protein QZH41_020642 [Actinostola sp. cb2023]